MPHMTGSDENSHLNGLFFPARLAICCKIRGFKRQLASSWLLITARRFGEILEKRKKLIIFNTLKAPHPLNKKVELE
ncbi:hypothetical protein SEEH0138_07832 [Salmonella enterica subsp. enterica serovar Heidelberg str. 92-0138]|uniref:hypothetical protein n=1 Tax=Salmonella enterica TaxID=28901 RepID=UPI00061EC22E|nr:hypothetical protein [Salmonella enterica]KJU58345.1 hypothetical protein SEEH0138_07832 [Salmonella enterica subsp. enterica serovar Heidelberg str. 92-0138]